MNQLQMMKKCLLYLMLKVVAFSGFQLNIFAIEFKLLLLLLLINN